MTQKVKDSKDTHHNQSARLLATETWLHSLQRQKVDLRQAFAVFDCHNSGSIDVRTFRTVLTRCGTMPLTDEEAGHWIQRLDRRKDGRIRLAELEELLFPEEETDTLLNIHNWEPV